VDSNARFWNSERDLESLAEFIRVWLVDNGRWGSRVFIIGESYGGFRAAGLPFFLSKLGISTSGTAMVSPVLGYKYFVPTPIDIEYDVTIVPTAAAVARYHGLLAEGLRKMPVKELTDMAWEWANTEYRQALSKVNRLSEEQFQAVAKELSRLTSLPEVEFVARGLRFPYNFYELVLRGKRLVVSPYDGRMTAPSSYFMDNAEDPAQHLVNEYYKTALMSFLQDTVGVKTLRPYLGFSDAVFFNWRFIDGTSETSIGMPETASNLAVQMRRFPSLKVFLAMGRYDMVCPPESVLVALDTLDVPKDRLANIEAHMYEGGHMMYANPEEARRLCEGLSAWIAATVK
jgi:carboxypeptidase C (cathepsin A)